MKRLRVGAVLAFAVIAAGLIVAGCGDSEEKNDYVDQVNELQLAYVDDVTEAVGANPPSTPKEAAAAAGELAELTDGVADDIEAVDAPEDVADLHDQLVAALRGVATDITKTQGALTSGDPQKATEAATQLQTAITGAQTELNSLIEQINSTLQE